MVDFPDKIDSKFRYVLLAAHRAEQIMRGSQPKMPRDGVKNTTAAMEEISADVVRWDYGPAEEVPPEDELGLEESPAPEAAKGAADEA